MKNKQLIQQFMEENGIEFNKPFWVKTYNEIGMVKCRIIEDKKIGIPETEILFWKKEEKLECSRRDVVNACYVW